MKFTTEQESINYFIKWLQQHKFENIQPTQNDQPFCWYDIEAERLGKKYRFELKRRNMLSTKYNDGICECYKYKEFKNALEEKVINEGYLVCLFDDCITLSSFKTTPLYEDVVYANKTTDFENKNQVKKHFIHFKQNYKYEYVDF